MKRVSLKIGRVLLAGVVLLLLIGVPVVLGQTGTFVHSEQDFGSRNSYAVAMSDLNGDGKLDLFVANAFGQANQIWLNGGQGNFSNSQSIGNEDSKEVALGDLDGDGDVDAFVVNYGQSSRVWVNNGAGSFSAATQTFPSGLSYGIALGDLNGDNKLDAFMTNYGQPNRVYLNQSVAGTIVFSNSGQLLGNNDSLNVVLGDVDGDGDADAVVANYAQASQVWLNNGSGVFSPGHTFSVANSVDIGLSDLDGDGDKDVLISNYNQASTVWLNNGSGVFSLNQSLTAAASRGLKMGDVDGDGDNDAVVSNYNQASTMWLNNGAGTLSVGQSLNNAASRDVALGDVNGDGRLDAVMSNYLQSNSVWFNTLSNLAITQQVNSPNLVAGERITYTITFTNQGAYTVSGAIITDIVPASVINRGYSSSGVVVVTSTGGSNYSWNVAKLSANQSGVIVVSGLVDPNLGSVTVFSNTVLIASPLKESNSNNNSSTVWVTASPPPVPPSGVTVSCPSTGLVGQSYSCTAQVSPLSVTMPLTYSWSGTGQNPQVQVVSANSSSVNLPWSTPGMQSVTVTVTGVGGVVMGSSSLTLYQPPTGLVINGPSSGAVNTSYTFDGVVSPLTVSQPLAYSWSPAPTSGQGTAQATYSWPTAGSQMITLVADNSYGTVTYSHIITITPIISKLLQIVALAFDNLVTSTGNLTPYYTDTVEAIRLGTLSQPNNTVIVLADLDQEGDTHILWVQHGVITPLHGLPDTQGVWQNSLREYDMADGVTLGGFLLWARQTYTHNQATFSYVGHGTALAPETPITNLLNYQPIQPRQGYLPLPHKTGAPDFTDHHTNSVYTRSLISPNDLATALNTATHQGADKFAVVDLIHCFSASIEEFYELKDYATMLIGSPNYTYLVPQSLGQMIATTQVSQTSSAMAINMIKQYNLSLGQAEHDVYVGSHPRLLVAVDTRKLEPVKQAWDILSGYLLQDFQRDKLLQAYQASRKYDSTFCEPQDWQLDSPDALVDMADFATALQQQFSNNSAIVSAVAKVQTELAAAIIATEQLGGQPWFTRLLTKPTWNLSDTRYHGLSLFANFIARHDVDGKDYLNFQAYWYNNLNRVDNPKPYRFIQSKGSNWADVLNRYWNDGRTYEIEFCMPTFPKSSSKLTLNLIPPTIVPKINTTLWVTVAVSNVQLFDRIEGVGFLLTSSDVTVLRPACDKSPVVVPEGIVPMANVKSEGNCTETGWNYSLTSETITRSGSLVRLPFYTVKGGQATIAITPSQIANSRGSLLEHDVVANAIQVVAHNSVDGIISCQYRTICPTIQVTLMDTTGQVISQTDTVDRYQFVNLAPGTYSLYYRSQLHPPLFLVATRTITITTNSNVTMNVRLWGGEIYRDGKIDTYDWRLLKAATFPVNDPAFDLNGDGQTNVGDLVLLNQNIGWANSYVDAPTARDNPAIAPSNPQNISSTAMLTLHRLETNLYGVNIEQVDNPLAFIGLQFKVTGTVTTVIPQGKFVGGFLNWHQDGDKLYIVAATPENSLLTTSAEIFQIQLVGDLEITASNLVFISKYYLPIVEKILDVTK